MNLYRSYLCLLAVAVFALRANAVVIPTNFGIGADAEVRESNPTQNRGDSTELGSRVLNDFLLGSANDGSDRNSAIYTRFDLSAVSGLPTAETAFRMSYRNNNLNGSRIQDTVTPNPAVRTGIAVYGLTNNALTWAEDTIIYLTAPGISFDGDVGTKDFNSDLSFLGTVAFPEIGTQNHLPIGGFLELHSAALNTFVGNAIAANATSITLVTTMIHGGDAPFGNWLDFNYLFNPKEQTTLNSDNYDPDGTGSVGNAFGTDNSTGAFSPQLVLTPNYPLVYEGFDYSPPGVDLLGANGGESFAGPWELANANAKYSVGAGSLSYPGLATTGNRVTTPAITSGVIPSISRTLSTPIGQPDTTQYLSFLVRPEGTLNEGNFNGFIGFLLDGATSDLFIGKPGDGAIDQFVLENRGGTLQHASGVTVEVGQEYLLVVRADFAAGNDVFTLYIDPVPGAEEPLSGIVKNDVDVGIINSLLLYSTGAFSIDEIRIGSSFADVVPTAVVLPGDYNQDGVVDAADYALWRKNPTSYGGDPDGYNTWRSHYRETTGSSAGASANAAVPEPATLGLLILAAAVASTRRYRNR